MNKECNNCGKGFNAVKQWQKYCSNACRVSAHKQGVHAKETQQNNEMETQQNNEMETQSTKQIDAMLERILNERQQVFESKIQAMQKEYENKILELRLSELERKVKDLEKATEDDGGVKMADVIAGVGSYFAAMQQQPKTTTNGK